METNEISKEILVALINKGEAPERIDLKNIEREAQELGKAYKIIYDSVKQTSK